ncbi:MAG TPA: alpha/beta fold hydrolase [Saprospiraceae bacterium]|nr:alpha/beta fold hydrolase [Saprospiraceae bacterium]
MNTPENTLRNIRRVGKVLNALAAVSPGMAGRAAFRVFCSPRRLPLRDKDRHFLDTAQQDHLRVDGATLRTYTWPAAQPDAPTILLLHGWESNSARWRKYVKPALAAGYRVQAFDAPANGQSGGSLLNVMVFSRAVRAFVEQHGSPYAMVGHSLGGAAAVMSTAMLQVPPPKKMVLLGVFAESTRVIQDFGNMLAASESVMKGLYREIERRTGLPLQDYSVRLKAASLTEVEGLVIHDADDEVAPVAEGQAIAQAWGCAYLETRGLGHRMQDKVVVEAVLHFVQHGVSGKNHAAS